MFLQSLLQLRQSSGFICLRVLLLLYSVLLHVFIIAANKQCESDLVWDVMETVLLNMQD